jgi:hypothetical protein
MMPRLPLVLSRLKPSTVLAQKRIWCRIRMSTLMTNSSSGHGDGFISGIRYFDGFAALLQASNSRKFVASRVDTRLAIGTNL